MNIITLTTDWGISDNYSAIFKAHLLREDAALQTVDVTHQIPSNNIAQAAFQIKTAYHYFPKNSVHIVDVNHQCQQNEQKYKMAVRNKTENTDDFPFMDYIAFQYDDHYFLCENNGIASLLCDKFAITEVVKLPEDKRYADFATFKAIPFYAKAAADLAKGVPLKKIGKKYDLDRVEIIRNIAPHVQRNEEHDIIYFYAQLIDNYGNIITNLTKKQFDAVADGRTRFDFKFSPLKVLENQKISASYNETRQSEALFLFGHSQYLEIWTKYAPLDKLILEQGAASHKISHWTFAVLFRKRDVSI